MIAIGARRTELLLPFQDLIDELEVVLAEAAAGRLSWLERTHMAGRQGVSFFSMLACDEQLAIHKLVSAKSGNKARQLPTVSGLVAVCSAESGQPLMVLDGPVLTARRTAAVSALALKRLAPTARRALIVGAGTLARSHVEALGLAGVRGILVQGRSVSQADRLVQFARSRGLNSEFLQPGRESVPEVDVVVTVTSSTTPVVRTVPASTHLLIAVGAYKPEMAEVSPAVVRGASAVYVDTLPGARREAGELIQAAIDWTQVRELADLVRQTPLVSGPGYRIFKSVGHSLWDLAAARVAHRRFAGTTCIEGNTLCSA